MVFAFKDEGGVHEWCTVGENGENVWEISSVEFLNERNSSIRENIGVEKEFELLLKRGWFYILNFNVWRRVDTINWNYTISMGISVIYGYLDLSAWAKLNIWMIWIINNLKIYLSKEISIIIYMIWEKLCLIIKNRNNNILRFFLLKFD